MILNPVVQGGESQKVTISIQGARITAYDCYGNSYSEGTFQTEAGKIICARRIMGIPALSGDGYAICETGENGLFMFMVNGDCILSSG